MTHTAWGDAVVYAKRAGKRLPTEAEFACVARGGLADAHFAWGNELKPRGLWAANIWQGRSPSENKYEDGYRTTSPVEAFPPNGFGLYAMGGNVWQWCADWYRLNYFAELAARGIAHAIADGRGHMSNFVPAWFALFEGGSEASNANDR